MNGHFVLLVEDDEDLRVTVAEILRDEGLEVAETSNGLEALAWLRTHRTPEVILLDLMMPRMDGIQFRTAQLSDPTLAGVPVVLMTASTIQQRVLDASGVHEVLRKPVEADQLVSKLRRYM